MFFVDSAEERMPQKTQAADKGQADATDAAGRKAKTLVERQGFSWSCMQGAV